MGGAKIAKSIFGLLSNAGDGGPSRYPFE